MWRLQISLWHTWWHKKTQSIKLTCDLVLTTKSKFSRKYLTCRYSFARGSLAREKTHGSLKTSANPFTSSICILLSAKQLLILSFRYCKLVSTTSSVFASIESMDCWLSWFSSLVFKINKAKNFVISPTWVSALCSSSGPCSPSLS